MNARRLRRRFDRASRGYEAAAVLEAEVGRRMLERLDCVRLAPERVLDAGAGTGRDAKALARRYPRAAIVALDQSLGMLGQVRAARGGILERWQRRAVAAVCAELAQLPLANASIDLVWSNLALHWLQEPAGALREFARVLRADGLLMFSGYGPDTFRELGPAQGRRFADMHDLGDLLATGGFCDPVMEMERITLTYADAAAFFADLRATGQSALLRLASSGESARCRIANLGSALDAARVDGRLAITLELVYGHAWRSAGSRTSGGHALVSVASLKRARH